MPRSTNEAKLIKAIGDDKRQRLIVALLDKPKYISELTKTLNMDRATVSYNLAVLEDAGILQSSFTILQKPHSKGKAAHVYSVNSATLKKALEPLLSIRQKLG
jgi:predicted transcriptional regulator